MDGSGLPPPGLPDGAGDPPPNRNHHSRIRTMTTTMIPMISDALLSAGPGPGGGLLTTTGPLIRRPPQAAGVGPDRAAGPVTGGQHAGPAGVTVPCRAPGAAGARPDTTGPADCEIVTAQSLDN